MNKEECKAEFESVMCAFTKELSAEIYQQGWKDQYENDPIYACVNLLCGLSNSGRMTLERRISLALVLASHIINFEHWPVANFNVVYTKVRDYIPDKNFDSLDLSNALKELGPKWVQSSKPKPGEKCEYQSNTQGWAEW